jgi:hypothetical protein
MTETVDLLELLSKLVKQADEEEEEATSYYVANE